MYVDSKLFAFLMKSKLIFHAQHIDKIIRLLGQGTFGKVVEAYDRDMRTKVAVKIIRAIQKYR